MPSTAVEHEGYIAQCYEQSMEDRAGRWETPAGKFVTACRKGDIAEMEHQWNTQGLSGQVSLDNPMNEVYEAFEYMFKAPQVARTHVPIYLAIIHNHPEAVRWLANNGATFKESPLKVIEAKYSTQEWDPTWVAPPPLVLACEIAKPACVAVLLELGAPVADFRLYTLTDRPAIYLRPNIIVKSALSAAVKHGDAALVSMLVAAIKERGQLESKVVDVVVDAQYKCHAYGRLDLEALIAPIAPPQDSFEGVSPDLCIPAPDRFYDVDDFQTRPMNAEELKAWRARHAELAAQDFPQPEVPENTEGFCLVNCDETPLTVFCTPETGGDDVRAVYDDWHVLFPGCKATLPRTNQHLVCVRRLDTWERKGWYHYPPATYMIHSFDRVEVRSSRADQPGDGAEAPLAHRDVDDAPFADADKVTLVNRTGAQLMAMVTGYSGGNGSWYPLADGTHDTWSRKRFAWELVAFEFMDGRRRGFYRHVGCTYIVYSYDDIVEKRAPQHIATLDAARAVAPVEDQVPASVINIEEEPDMGSEEE